MKKVNRKVAIWGNQRICIECIRHLMKNDVEISYVVGCEKSVDRKYNYESLKKFCSKQGLVYYQPSKLDNNFINVISENSPPLALSLYYRNIIPEKYIKVFKQGIVNMHSSLLPAYRGPVPTLWGLLSGERTFGLTLHYIDKGVDTGDIVGQLAFEVNEPVTGYELNEIAMDYGIKLFKQEIFGILSNSNKRSKQDNGNATYYGKYNDKFRYLNWYQKKDEIERAVRVFTRPYDGALARLSGSKLIVWKAKSVSIGLNVAGGPGRITAVDDNRIRVTTVDGYLDILEYELMKKVNIRKGMNFDI